MILLGLNVVNSIDTQDFVLYSSVYFKQNLIVAEKKMILCGILLGEGFNKKKYKLGLLAQPPLTPTYLRNLGSLNRCKGGGYNCQNPNQTSTQPNLTYVWFY